MKALILAGGRGSRLGDWTENKSKSMIKLLEKPLIEYNLEHAVEADAKEIIIVVGYKKEEIIKFVGNTYRGIPVKYVVQRVQKGVVNAIECAREEIGNSDFILMLADEIVINAKIKEMIKKFKKQNLFAICGVIFEEENSSIRKTYSAMINETGRVFRLIEKPRFPVNRIKGTGHCIFKNEILRYIEKTPISMKRGEKELVDMIQEAIDEGKKVQVYHLTEGYENVNTEDDFNSAEELVRKNNPSVLIVHTQMKFLGGAELLIVELANWMTKRGIKNDILALSKSKEVENKLIDTNIIIPNHNIDLRPPGFKNTGDILNFVKIYRKELKRLIKNYDVINFHNFPVTWTLFPKRKPCVWMLNEPPNLWSKPNASIILKILNRLRNYLDKIIVRNSVDIICVADEPNQERAKTRYKKNSQIVYYGVNYDFFSKGNSKKAADKLDLKGKVVVVQSGMITKTKNQLESIKTISEVKKEIPNILLVLAGTWDMDYKKKIDDYIKNKKLEKHVLFTGNLDREDLRDLYKASDAGIYPIGKQGGWLAPFEHLCGGSPVIVSKELGAASIIKRFKLGIITNDYSNALLDVCKNLNMHKKDSSRRKKEIKKSLGWNVFADKMIKAFKEAWKKYH